MHTSAALPRPGASTRAANAVAIASGKGGVGKTWLSITLAHALARHGRRVLLFDGDLGLANVDIQLGLMPEHDLSSVLARRASMAEATTHFAEGGFHLLVGRSGSGCLAALTPQRLAAFGCDMAALAARYDTLLLDLGAGVDGPVRTFSRIAGQCLVVVTGEPTSLTDAYAFIKLSLAEGGVDGITIVVNMAASIADGEHTYATLRKACETFLALSPPLAGIIRRDPKVRQAIRAQVPLLTRYPNTIAAGDVERIARRLTAPAALPTP
jgi:flagellar biosynthesis protein FlhG